MAGHIASHYLQTCLYTNYQTRTTKTHSKRVLRLHKEAPRLNRIVQDGSCRTIVSPSSSRPRYSLRSGSYAGRSLPTPSPTTHGHALRTLQRSCPLPMVIVRRPPTRSPNEVASVQPRRSSLLCRRNAAGPLDLQRLSLLLHLLHLLQQATSNTPRVVVIIPCGPKSDGCRSRT